VEEARWLFANTYPGPDGQTWYLSYGGVDCAFVILNWGRG